MEVVIIGAGPAGLTAAYQLGKTGNTCTVLEADSVVGGISRTVERSGWRFDIGGHRFFTKVDQVEKLWHEILGADEFLLRPRSSRIYYEGKFYDYPIRPLNALRNLGPREAARCIGSFLAVRLRPPKDQSSLEGYIVANYGWRLYDHFFKTYNEKVWGVPASAISADWGAQRIKGMSLWSAAWEPVRARWAGRRKDPTEQITSLIEEFQYPKYGPGMMWERCTELVRDQGSSVVMDARVRRLERSGGRAVRVVAEGPEGEVSYPASAVISSMPISELVLAMEPGAPEAVIDAAKGLGYRDFLSIALVVPAGKVPWTDNWLYIHAPEVKTMRVQNFGSWSPFMVKDGRNVLGLEYTAKEGDEWWAAPDEELVNIGKRELETIGLIRAGDVEAGYVVRMPKAYPVYDEGYDERVQTIRTWIESEVPNVHPVGRNGMHRYNNQDHSMFTAMLTVENLLGAAHDIWSVNVEAEYHEEQHREGQHREGQHREGRKGARGAATSSGSTTGTGRSAPVLPRN